MNTLYNSVLKMNRVKSYKLFAAILLVSVLTIGCSNFEEINTNIQGVTPEMAKRDGVAAGGFIQSLERQVVPVGTAANKTDIINNYQTAYHLGPDTWSGYFAQNGYWNGGNNHTTYALINDWIHSTFKESYTKAYTPWLSIRKASGADSEAYALAQILKISSWQKATDCFGPIPYSKAGEGLFVTPYDSQEDVYTFMLEDLEKAISKLTELHKQGGLLFPNYDLIYAGDTHKWVKYANSLMLRMAMRIRFADPEKARQYAEKAVNHEFGVMTDVNDGASISFAQGLQFENPIERFAVQYGETKMGISAYSYLVGYKDPRLEKYYSPTEVEEAPELDFANNKKYVSVPAGVGKKKFAKASKPNIERNTPVHWLLTSEVYFLRAEGELLGWNMGGDAQEFYRTGISMSFEENGVTEDVDSYINSDLKPAEAAYLELVQSGSWWNPEEKAVVSQKQPISDVTVKFEGSDEEKFEKIMIQKWIALYPNGIEAWSEWRRTGYPKLYSIQNNCSNGVVDTELGIRRINYSLVDGRTNEELDVYNKAVEMLGGPDSPATSLWWDKK